MENKLIEIYLLVCHFYDMNKRLHLQENRNRQPTLSVAELMTIYLFGQLNGHFKSDISTTLSTIIGAIAFLLCPRIKPFRAA